MEQVTIVGGGIAGLTAAIHLAKGGGRAVLHEAARELGGRARTQSGEHRVNVGPHALYRRGDFGRWLSREGLLPPHHYPSLTGLRLLSDGKLGRSAPGLVKVMRSGGRSAPIDEDYRSWATRSLGERAARTAIGFASLPTYHPDPGRLSARFVHERIARSSQWRPVWYLNGGWSALVAKLAERARELGVEIVTQSRLRELPPGLCIVATDLRSAAQLLDRPSLQWPATRGALLDLALERWRGDPTAVLDLDRRVYLSNYAAHDASIAPAGESLFQAFAGVLEGEDDGAAHARIEAVLDAAYPGWRERTVWRRTAISQSGTGPADPPGTSWRDRPAIDQGAGRYLIGDCVAAPGVLAEVAFESARRAAEEVLRKLE